MTKLSEVINAKKNQFESNDKWSKECAWKFFLSIKQNKFNNFNLFQGVLSKISSN